MLKQTNLKEVKEVAKAMLMFDFDRNAPFFPMITSHPIFESGVQFSRKTNELLDITNSEENLELIRQEYIEAIDSIKKLFEVYLIIRRSYRLTFLKFIKPYLSNEDFSELLADAWVNSENPNQDVNVSLYMASRWFKQADKSILMNEEELKVYNALPQEFTIYRRVSVGRETHGMSWTRDLETANCFFAHRFDRDDEIGYIQSATVKKENVLAYFIHENEIVAYFDDLNDVQIL